MTKYKTVESPCFVCRKEESDDSFSAGKTTHIIKITGDYGFSVSICTCCGNIKDTNIVDEYKNYLKVEKEENIKKKITRLKEQILRNSYKASAHIIHSDKKEILIKESDLLEGVAKAEKLLEIAKIDEWLNGPYGEASRDLEQDLHDKLATLKELMSKEQYDAFIKSNENLLAWEIKKQN